jgi:hypothetical protein
MWRPGRDRRDLNRLTASTSPLTATVVPNATANPAQGVCSKTLPPSRPRKNA